jgi:hypothetical protein
VLGLAAGAFLAAVTGWPIMLPVGVAAVVGLPVLLSEPPQTELRLLEALDRWVRVMLGVMSTGPAENTRSSWGLWQGQLTLTPMTGMIL